MQKYQYFSEKYLINFRKILKKKKNYFCKRINPLQNNHSLISVQKVDVNQL